MLDTIRFIPNYLEAGTGFKIVGIDKENKEYSLRVYPLFDELRCKKWWFFYGKCKNDSARIANAKKRGDKSFFYNGKIFHVSENQILRADIVEQAPPQDRVSFGLITLPFKFRMFDDKSFETNFNLNTTLNVRIKQLWSAGIYAQVGAGIGNTNLYNSNAPGVDPNEEINAAALTILSGVMLQYKKVQAGLYIGWDHINNQDRYQWKYNGKPWLGFGVGYQLFKIDLGGDKKQNKQ